MTFKKRKPDITIIELKPIESAGDLVLSEGIQSYAEPQVSFWRRHFLFLGIVIVPSFLAILYFGLLLSNMYAVNASYVIRSVNGAGNSAFSILGGGQSYARSEEDTLAVNAYLQSRSALEKVSDIVARNLGRSSVDLFHRYPSLLGRNTKEALFGKYKDLIAINVDGNGITNLEVRSYEPEDTKELAERLLKLGEELVNRMNERAMSDAVRLAKATVSESEARFTAEQAKLTEFRNREMVVDPQRQTTSALEVINQLMTRVADDEASLAQMVALSPNNPQIPALKARIRAFRSQIDEQRDRVVGAKDSIVSKLSEFEQLSLRHELASRGLAAAVASLESARQEAQRQQFYLETIVSPVLPDFPRYPSRLISILVSIFVSLIIYWIVKKTAALVSEHQL